MTNGEDFHASFILRNCGELRKFTRSNSRILEGIERSKASQISISFADFGKRKRNAAVNAINKIRRGSPRRVLPQLQVQGRYASPHVPQLPADATSASTTADFTVLPEEEAAQSRHAPTSCHAVFDAVNKSKSISYLRQRHEKPFSPSTCILFSREFAISTCARLPERRKNLSLLVWARDKEIIFRSFLALPHSLILFSNALIHSNRE